jgi:hypothetical protein
MWSLDFRSLTAAGRSRRGRLLPAALACPICATSAAFTSKSPMSAGATAGRVADHAPDVLWLTVEVMAARDKRPASAVARPGGDRGARRRLSPLHRVDALAQAGRIDEAMAEWAASIELGDPRAASRFCRPGLHFVDPPFALAWRAGLGRPLDRAGRQAGVSFPFLFFRPTLRSDGRPI